MNHRVGTSSPKMVNTTAGLTSFVCLLVNPVHRWCSAVSNDGYETRVTVLAPSFPCDRSLKFVQGFEVV